MILRPLLFSLIAVTIISCENIGLFDDNFQAPQPKPTVFNRDIDDGISIKVTQSQEASANLAIETTLSLKSGKPLNDFQFHILIRRNQDGLYKTFASELFRISGNVTTWSDTLKAKVPFLFGPEDYFVYIIKSSSAANDYAGCYTGVSITSKDSQVIKATAGTAIIDVRGKVDIEMAEDLGRIRYLRGTNISPSDIRGDSYDKVNNRIGPVNLTKTPDKNPTDSLILTFLINEEASVNSLTLKLKKH